MCGLNGCGGYTSRTQHTEWGGGGRDNEEGQQQPPTWMLFGRNVRENERIGMHWGGTLPLDLPIDNMHSFHMIQQ